MRKKKRVPKLPRLNQFSVGKAALLFSYGLQPHEVAEWMYRRYCKQWKIGSPEQMHAFLFTQKPGLRPNSERMFAGKSKEEIKRVYYAWLEKVRKQSSRTRKLNQNPVFAQKQVKRMQKRWKEDTAFIQGQSNRMWKRWHEDPEFRKRQTKRIQELNQDPEFIKKRKEKLQKIFDDPKRSRIRNQKISIALKKYWDLIRTSLRAEFLSRGLISEVEFSEDERGRTIVTDIVATIKTPETESIQRERKRMVLNAINGLKPFEREAVSAIFFEGKTHEETAAMLGLEMTQFNILLQIAYQNIAPKLKHLL